MKKNLFTKYFCICFSIILISITFLGVVLLVFSGQYFKSDKYALLSKNMNAVVSITSTNYSNNHYLYVSADYVMPYYILLGDAISADIFLVNMQGEPLISSSNGWAEDVLQSDVVPTSLLDKITPGMEYREVGNLGGFYSGAHYIVGKPIVNANNEVKAVVFAASSAAGLTTFLVDIFQIFLISAGVVMLFSFIIVYFITSNMVRPLQQMLAATQSFSKGDFSIRVPVEGDDEVAKLASAFNSMATSLAVQESGRRSFTANVSHELKTPMTTIGGFIDGILDGTIPPEQQTFYLKIVSSEIQRLSRLVRSMLSISRIEAGEQKIQPEPVDITEIVTRTLFSFEKPLEAKNIDVRGLDTEKLTVMADPDLIHQVVYNLIDNAVKFVNENGYLEFSFRTEGQNVLVSVKNSGARHLPRGDSQTLRPVL